MKVQLEDASNTMVPRAGRRAGCGGLQATVGVVIVIRLRCNAKPHHLKNCEGNKCVLIRLRNRIIGLDILWFRDEQGTSGDLELCLLRMLRSPLS